MFGIHKEIFRIRIRISIKVIKLTAVIRLRHHLTVRIAFHQAWYVKGMPVNSNLVINPLLRLCHDFATTDVRPTSRHGEISVPTKFRLNVPDMSKCIGWAREFDL